jgi:hypothetical protein
VWTGDREDVKIYPLFDDAAYCVSGWHLVGLITRSSSRPGAFLPPGTLSVGSHALRVIVIDPVFGDADFTVAFTGLPC